MSLATRCPACGTTFKVVRDQLRISDGWVRCGRCSQVFDATVELQEAPEARPEPPVCAPPPAEAHDSDEALRDEGPREAVDAQVQADSPVEDESEVDFLDDSAFGALEPHPSGLPPSQELAGDTAEPERDNRPPVAAVVASMPWPDANLLSLGDEGRAAVRPPAPPPLSFPNIELSLASAPPPASAPMAEAADAGGAARTAADDAGNVQLQKALRRARAKSAKIAKSRQAREQKEAAATDAAPLVLAASEPEAIVADATTMPSLFGDEKKHDGFWQRIAVRRAMLALAVLAALLLAGQVLYQERDIIVARQPGLRPALTSMCAMLGCEISALRQINDIKVDGASFSREKDGDGYRLSFTLRNAADVPLAMPAVELSLLDTQERAVVRRVLMPADFGAPAVLPARGERSASLTLKLTGSEAAAMPPVAGFRVETLYP
jgi:predicted Zn finger-like uncharacterized protein